MYMRMYMRMYMPELLLAVSTTVPTTRSKRPHFSKAIMTVVFCSMPEEHSINLVERSFGGGSHKWRFDLLSCLLLLKLILNSSDISQTEVESTCLLCRLRSQICQFGVDGGLLFLKFQTQKYCRH